MPNNVEVSRVTAPITTIAIVCGVVFSAFIYGSGEIRDSERESAERRIALKAELRAEMTAIEHRQNMTVFGHVSSMHHEGAFPSKEGDRLRERVDGIESRLRYLELTEGK